MKKSIATICALLICLFLIGGSALAATRGALEPAASAQAAPDLDAPIVRIKVIPKAKSVAEAELANLYGFTGTVEVVTDGQVMAAYEGMRLYAGDAVRTGSNSTASLDLDQGRLLMLDAGGELQLQEKSNGSLEVYLVKGTILNDVAKGQPEPYTVRTSNVTMGVLGTVFRVSVDGATGVTVAELYEGGLQVTFSTADGQEQSFTLEAGRRFTGDQTSMDGSVQGDKLITQPIYIDDLSTELLNMLHDALAERADTSGVTDLIEQIDTLLKERDGEPADPPRTVDQQDDAPVTAPTGPTQVVTTAPTTMDIFPVSAELGPSGWTVTVEWAAENPDVAGLDGFAGYVLSPDALTWLKQFCITGAEISGSTSFHFTGDSSKIALVKDQAGEILASTYSVDSFTGVAVQDRTDEVRIDIGADQEGTFVALEGTPTTTTPPTTTPTYTAQVDGVDVELTLTDPTAQIEISIEEAEGLAFTPEDTAVWNGVNGSIDLFGTVEAHSTVQQGNTAGMENEPPDVTAEEAQQDTAGAPPQEQTDGAGTGAAPAAEPPAAAPADSAAVGGAPAEPNASAPEATAPAVAPAPPEAPAA